MTHVPHPRRNGIVSGTPIVASGTFTLTPLECRVVEAAYTDDRQWFEDHPGRDDRIRPALPNEIPAGAMAELHDPGEPGPDEGWFVHVVKGPNGLLLRDYQVMPLDVPEDVPLDPIRWPS